MGSPRDDVAHSTCSASSNCSTVEGYTLHSPSLERIVGSAAAGIEKLIWMF